MGMMLGLVPLLGAAEQVQMKAEHVALFKNGYSQVRLVGELPAAKELELRGLPVPVEGSLWWQLPQGSKVVQVAGSIREREVPAVQYGIAELLAANVGKHVRLVMKGGQVYEGELTRRPLPAPLALTYTNHDGSAQQQELSQQAPVFLKNAQGELQEILTDTALSLAFAEPPEVPTRKELQPLLTMELSASAGGELRVDCLAGGLSWETAYRLDISDEAHPTLSCMATITNDMVDLEGVQLELVTGNPELGADGLPVSPLTRLSSMPSNRAAYKARSSRVAAPCAMEAEAADDDGDDDGSFGPVTRTQELYHYAIPSFSARKNSTVAREIFTQEPDCRHLYTCDLGTRRRCDEDEADVWHCLVLTNKADWPWSPGTLVCCSGGKLLARTSLKDTAPGRQARLRLATTPEIVVTLREEQAGMHTLSKHSKTTAADTEAETNEKADDDDPFATPPPPARTRGEKIVITYRGTITVQNNAAHPVELELKKTLPGITVESGRINTATLRRTWTFTLKPGESKNFTYSYDTLN